jgi:hypothetical protein
VTSCDSEVIDLIERISCIVKASVRSENVLFVDLIIRFVLLFKFGLLVLRID